MGDYIACGAGMQPMQTIATAINLPGGISKQDRIRERELFRFYRPIGLHDDPNSCTPTPNSPGCFLDPNKTSPISNKDVTLGALSQLVAHRLGAHRCMINVIGKEIQYTLVESTKTLDLNNQTTSEARGDEAWVGSGGSMHKRTSICETVISLPSLGTSPSFLVVPDLREHPEFKTRAYVTGPPYYRFYAGTPLKTARGIVIGALCAFAHEPRAGLSESEESFLVTIADTIMQYLEMRRAASERDKVTTMSKGLNAFITGSASQFATAKPENRLVPSLGSPAPVDGGKTEPRIPTASMKHSDIGIWPAAKPSEIPPAAAPPHKSRDHAPASHAANEFPGLIVTDEQIAADQTGSSKGSKPSTPSNPTSTTPGTETALDLENPATTLEAQFQATLARAAGLLGEALGLATGGGVVFYDTVARTDNSSDSGSNAASPFETHDPEEWGNFSDGAVTPGAFDGVIDSEGAKASVLGERVTGQPRQEKTDRGYRKLTSRMLAKYIRRYPSGKVWEFDDHGVIPAQDDGQGGFPNIGHVMFEKEARYRNEWACLSSLFPGASSVMFLPLFDANIGRHYSGCFAWTTDATSRFSTDVEFSFLTAFGNSISAEISRLATIDADQRKSDFIGSISHELRSPLHGVLASSEFLADTALDSFQSTLVATIDSCGRTLLDTINHVLDYSKINSLRRTWKKEVKVEMLATKKAQSAREGKPLINSGIMSILGSTDLAAVTEEVIDSVYAGKIYAKTFSPADITDIGAFGAAGTQPGDSTMAKTADKSNVQVLLDIAPGDYHFVTQPGAIRRIIMNVFGNALKYTEEGSIMVRLWQQGVEGYASHNEDHRHKVILVIRDTGKGISSGYLRTRLYTPFAQENDLGPGTGLGLSIVRNIVTMLKGDIEIRSKVGKGTDVRITLPNLKRPLSEPKQSASDGTKLTLADFQYLGALKRTVTIGLWGFGDDPGNLSGETEQILRQYLQDWCSAKCITNWSADTRPDAIILDEQLLPHLEQDPSFSNMNLIVLCRDSNAGSNAKWAQHHFLLMPFGPYKLARTVRKCIELAKRGSSMDGIVFGQARQLGLTAADEQLRLQLGVANMDNTKLAVARSSHSDAIGSDPTLTPVRAGRPKLSTLNTDPRVPTRNIFSRRADSGMMPASAMGLRASEATMPSSPSRESQREQLRRAPRGTSPQVQRNPKVLVVDDNPTNRLLLRTFLRKRGIGSDEAQDGLLAVKAATRDAQDRYDIIFMDISMPNMNGFEATREIRKWEASVKAKMPRPGMACPSSASCGIGSIGIGSQQAKNSTSALRGMAFKGDSMGSMEQALESGMTSEMGQHKPATLPESSSKTTEGNKNHSGWSPTLIVALTGLASDRDQSEAFISGVDLYLTKPVSFKQVGQMIEGWIANGGLAEPSD